MTATPAIAALIAAGVPHEVVKFEHDPQQRGFGGEISPFGQRKRLPTVVDADALTWERVYCSAGRRGWDVAVDPRDLIRLTSAAVAAIQA